MLLPRTLRLDPSDTLIFDCAAPPGEWAVPGGFAFAEETPAAMAGRRRQEFRAGFLGIGSFGWSTLVEIAAATPAERAAATAALAAHLRATYGAPDAAAAVAAAEEELAFAESLCSYPPGTVLALDRAIEEGALRERFRSLRRRAVGDPANPWGGLPVFALVEATDDAPAEPVDLIGRAS